MLATDIYNHFFQNTFRFRFCRDTILTNFLSVSEGWRETVGAGVAESPLFTYRSHRVKLYLRQS